LLGSLWFNSFSAGGGGAAADYELISTTILGSSAASVTFSSIPNTFRHLQLRITLRDTFATEQIGASMQFNGDTGSNYAYHFLKGNGGTVTSSSAAGYDRLDILRTSGSNATSGIYMPQIIDILDYASTSKNKTARVLTGGDTTNVKYIGLHSGLWISTAAINSINIYSQTLATGSRFSLYGLK
jgi:hypothetical protein